MIVASAGPRQQPAVVPQPRRGSECRGPGRCRALRRDGPHGVGAREGPPVAGDDQDLAGVRRVSVEDRARHPGPGLAPLALGDRIPEEDADGSSGVFVSHVIRGAGATPPGQTFGTTVWCCVRHWPSVLARRTSSAGLLGLARGLSPCAYPNRLRSYPQPEADVAARVLPSPASLQPRLRRRAQSSRRTACTRGRA